MDDDEKANVVVPLCHIPGGVAALLGVDERMRWLPTTWGKDRLWE